MPSMNYARARKVLDQEFAAAEALYCDGRSPAVPAGVGGACQGVFESRTQAYREVLLGCVLARMLDKRTDIRRPYVHQGANSFNGRTLDEKVINPFLHEKRIPCSKGPYLGVFRRSVQFTAETRKGLRDTLGYDRFLSVIEYARSQADAKALRELLRLLLHRFIGLRDAAEIPLTRLQRVSLDQYDSLITALLGTKSGGRFPMLLVVATFTAIKEFFGTDWEIQYQDINVADSASGAGGDITIKQQGRVVLAAEVTERAIDRSRVAATFSAKVGPLGIQDYLFLVRQPAVAPDVKQQAQQYFAQGHEVNFLELKNWILTILATIGTRGREIFNMTMVALLEKPDVPGQLKVIWNERLDSLIG